MSSRLERLVAMDEEIRRGRYPNVQRFCDMFEVQPRTVYDDIRILKDRMGVEVEFDRFNNGYYNKNPKKKLPQFELSNGEVFLLTLGKDMLSQYTGTSFEQILRGALEKIYHRLPDRVNVDMDDFRSMVRFNAGPAVEISRKMFLDLNRACEKDLLADITYTAASSGEVTTRRIEPKRLLEHRGTWYVVAYCQLRGALRLFAMHRIQAYELAEGDFHTTPDEEIDEWLKSPLFLEHREHSHKVSIRFNASSSRYIRERKWHATQEIEELADGGCVLRFTSSGLDEVKRWVLCYGKDAEVLEPAALREMVKVDLREALNQY